MEVKTKKGFTLIELLVVIAIIGLLASIVAVTVNNARIKARDVRRKVDLKTIATAFELHYDDKNTYVVPGGWNNTGTGWFNYEGGPYVKSIAHAMVDAGVFAKAPVDPSGVVSGDSGTIVHAYMAYICLDNNFVVYAALEKPATEDIATFNTAEAACLDGYGSYGMNYAVR